MWFKKPKPVRMVRCKKCGYELDWNGDTTPGTGTFIYNRMTEGTVPWCPRCTYKLITDNIGRMEDI
jgi:hypothetical protein